MATKSYSKHKEFKEYSTSSNVPYTDEQFDMLKSELIPKGSKLNSLGRDGGGGTREYHYEYKEEKHPSGKYDRKDLHTVEEYTIPAQKVPKATEARTYYYEKEDRQLPAVNSSSGTRTYNYETTTSTPTYSKVKTSKVTKEVSQNVDELDSLLDDLQKDQERQLYKSGYTSDTAESSSFDYKVGSPAKAPSSGYSTLKREELSSSWNAPAPVRTQELRQEMFREEKTESRVLPTAPPTAVCDHCHHMSNTATLSRSSTPMSKVTTTVKTYTYEVPAGQDPASLPLPALPDHHHTYHSSSENLRSSTNTLKVPPAGCQYCTHCNSHIRQYRHVTTADEHSSERTVLPPVVSAEPHNGHSPYGPSSYKLVESYSSHSRQPSPGPFPRPHTPSSTQQPPKRLDDLLADFPEARFPTQPDGVVRRKVEVTHESSTARSGAAPAPGGLSPAPAPGGLSPAPAGPRPLGGSKNVAGPAVYYPPGHTPFAKKEGAAYQASAMQGGGAYASGRGMYEYESGSRSKEKHSETKTAVPVCLPLCCAMPCVIM